MSVARKQFSDALDVLGVVDPYGADVEGVEGEMLITPELDACRPDPNQPRRLLPDDLRERLQAGEAPAEVLWEAWERCLGKGLYQAMRSRDLSPAEALVRRREEGVLDLALQLTLEGLVELADSIALHGLRQPINVYDRGEGRYRIAEGERRWWAHVYLLNVLLHFEASTILARVHPLPDDELSVLARQQAENVHRRDLSAVARARAITRVREALTLEVSGTTGSTNPQHFPTDQEVSGTDGSTNLGGRPRRLDAITVSQLDDVTGQRLAELSGRGMTGRTVRLYLALLTLPPEAQALAEAASLGERALRPVVSLEDVKEQIRLVHALAAGEMTPTQAASEAKRIRSRKETRGEESDTARALTRFRASLRFAADDLPEPAHLAAQIAQLSPQKRSQMLDYARRYLSLLQAILEAGEPLLAQDDL
jgi:ParB-like chromosome segregation protein Spo0J